MAHWYDMPAVLPAHNQIVWCRRTSWISAPFPAIWDQSSETFTTLITGLTCDWSDVARWSAYTDDPPTSSLVVTGTPSPNVTGIYTQRGICQTQPFFQRSNDSYFIWYSPTLAQWHLAPYVRTTGSYYWYTALNPDPSILTADYSPVGTATGTITVAYLT